MCADCCPADSPLPANIYLPAIPQMAVVFGQSIGRMNLTVTTYLVFQGCAPLFWGPLSDRYGRRPIFIACLVVLIASCIGLALCPTNAFWLLLLLRCMQSAGCASTIALGAGVIGDISIPAERGGFFGVSNVGPMIAPAVAPVIGGALAQHLGWRAVFWFLVISASLCCVFLILFYPETARNIAGNGDVPLPRIYRPVIPIIGRGRVGAGPPMPGTRKPYINPLTIFTYPDICLNLLITGTIYATWYTVTATISSSFKEVYGLSETELGLWYIPMGCGMAIGAFVTGKIQDWEYRRVAAETPAHVPFPKELARLRSMPVYVVLFTGAVLGWGFCLEYKTHKAVLGVLSFISKHAPSLLFFSPDNRTALTRAVGYNMVAVLNTTSTLLIDLLQSRSSAATACTNFVRCSLAAVFVACIHTMVDRLTYKWCYVLLGCLCLTTLPLIWLSIRVGSRWRLARDVKTGAI
ncbi:hypothetical protein TD95_000718 [Thielaviopsis punctulata]|uniref:Major facilitator superfamily (MFS) profile domain-containing protein n=1 Tax=Thielaviopsis punctulata TaxID=72032 RepID=A0A0F4ZL47_9PEZI|nr:hypothetical protein TD95_000718 [Thielaviopsis punctulata]